MLKRLVKCFIPAENSSANPAPPWEGIGLPIGALAAASYFSTVDGWAFAIGVSLTWVLLTVTGRITSPKRATRSTRPPSVADLDGERAWYWFSGGSFTRPIIVCVHRGFRKGEGEGAEEQLTCNFNGRYPDLWREEWPAGSWAGPIPYPEAKGHQS